MRVGYLGPQGTFSHQALLASGVGDHAEAIPLASIYDTVMAVEAGEVEWSLVPIENALEGSVDITLDALARDAESVEIVGEFVQRIRNCLIAPRELELAQIEVVHSHPQANAQCAGFLRARLPGARVVSASSTAAAVREVLATPDAPHAALGNRLAAELYGGTIMLDGVDDDAGNETRFVWLARRSSEGTARSEPERAARGEPERAAQSGPERAARSASSVERKTSLVFWGAGDEQPGWLVTCLDEFARREINLTRIESRPRRVGLGRYMFFADLAGGLGSPVVDTAIAGLRTHCEEVRILGSYAPATLAAKD